VSELLPGEPVRPGDPFGRALDAACRGLAIAGGLLLLAVVLLSGTSIALRALTAKPVPGDFELVQLATAVAVSSFLPYCQMRREHVIVDFFTANLRPRARLALDVIGALLLAGTAGLVAWRIVPGALSMRGSGETSMILGVPLWWGYAPMVPCFGLLALAGLYTAWTDLRCTRA
jgi:TRAP-type C4-dicarboxylate transport system permease small subunit